MQIGKLNKRIALYTVTRVADGMGGFTETPVKVKDTWGMIRPLSAREVLNYGLELGERNAEIKIYFDGEIDQSNYIVFGSRNYRIRSVINPMEYGMEYQLICTERTD